MDYMGSEKDWLFSCDEDHLMEPLISSPPNFFLTSFGLSLETGPESFAGRIIAFSYACVSVVEVTVVCCHLSREEPNDSIWLPTP